MYLPTCLTATVTLLTIAVTIQYRKWYRLTTPRSAIPTVGHWGGLGLGLRLGLGLGLGLGVRVRVDYCSYNTVPQIWQTASSEISFVLPADSQWSVSKLTSQQSPHRPR